MDLLPRSVDEFRDVHYWDKFFKKRGRDGTFEWYGEYSDLCGVLHKYCKAPHRTLVVGCGNSRLSEDLYDVGYRSLVNIDISEVAMRQMSERNAQRRPDMQFMTMDMRELSFDVGHFDCILDKATLDAIMAEDTEEINRDVDTIFSEFTRVLKAGGRYICVSLAQGHILEKLVSHFPRNWFVRVHKVEKTSAEGSALPVFVFIFTKKFSDTMPNILELCLRGEEEKPTRVDNVDQLKSGIKDAQNFAMLWQRLKSIHPGEESHFDLWASASASPSSKEALSEPRFGLYIVDCPGARYKSGPFAVFIVPQGREIEWMFATPAGRLILAQNAGFRRLVVVLLHRGHTYGSLQDIREEISGHVKDLAPDSLTGKGKIPVLSTAEDAGHRDICYTGNTSFSGDFVVEDYKTSSGYWHRRLIFLSDRNIVQSEARLFRDYPPSHCINRPLPPVPKQPPPGDENAPPTKNQKKKARKAKAKANKAADAAAAAAPEVEEETKDSAVEEKEEEKKAATTEEPAASAEESPTKEPAKKTKRKKQPRKAAGAQAAAAAVSDGDIDVSYLACEHHKAMVCGLAVVKGLARAPVGSEKVLLVGLGAGGLARFMHQFVPPVSIDAVEIDSEIHDVAKQWFGLPQDERMSVNVTDGVEYITQLSQQDPKPQYSAIMIDADSKDLTIGMSAPPAPFVTTEFLEKIKSITAPHGVFILNLVCRNVELQAEILQRVSATFHTTHCLDIAMEVNKIVVGLVHPLPCLHTQPDIHVPALEWVQESAQELEKVIVGLTPPTSQRNVQFIAALFAKLKMLPP